MAYNGLKIRFKATHLGPFVASYVLWVAPSLVLLTEFSFWNSTTIFSFWEPLRFFQHQSYIIKFVTIPKI
jgi:hypothetical protein